MAIIVDDSVYANEHLAKKFTRDGVIRFFSYHTNEFLEIQYANEKGVWIPGTYKRLIKIFRSRADGEEIFIDKRLIELADHLQDHFQVDTIEIISGFRSKEFNQYLKKTGHNVANESFHTKGMAMDIHIDEIDEAVLRDYMLKQKLGGVGYYGDKLMVHLDFGPVRKWFGGNFKENTEIGIFNKASAHKVRLDRLKYNLGDKLSMLIKPLRVSLIQDKIYLEKFYRGTWKTVGKLPYRISKSGLLEFTLNEKNLKQTEKLAGFYGKYRFRVDFEPEWQNSNEFYIKKR